MLELNQIHNMDALTGLKQMDDSSVNCIVTSPPYYGLRDYGSADQIGLEKTPEEYIERIVSVFREAKRVLRDDGTLWLNLGDSYAGNSTPGGGDPTIGKRNIGGNYQKKNIPSGVKRKDMLGIPWMIAFALRADGWYLRQDIIWSKPNPMPESVKDRCTKSHEYIFLLSKSLKYYCNMEAIQEPAKYSTDERAARAKDDHKSAPTNEHNGIRQRKPAGWDTRQGAHGSFHRDGRAADVEYTTSNSLTRNKRDVWSVATMPFKEAHFATFPEKLIEPCILAGCPAGGVVCDPFMGAGTTAVVANRFNRSYIGFDIKHEYCEMSEKRISTVQPMLKG